MTPECLGKPLVSIITPSYNQGTFIEDTILSVKNQDYPNIEHIIMDGGSTDQTLEILKKYDGTYNMRWVSKQDKGQAHAVNRGFDCTEGEVIGWLNSDDVYVLRDVVSSAVGVLQEDPSVALVHGNRLTIDEMDRLQRLYYSGEFRYSKFLRGLCSVYQETVFFRRVVAEHFRMNEQMQFAIDHEFWLRVGRVYSFRYLNKFMGGFRLHNASKSVSPKYDAGWNEEKKQLQEQYGYETRMRGEPNMIATVERKFRRVLAGAYTNYRYLPISLARMLALPAEQFAFPIKISKVRFFQYLTMSVIPRQMRAGQ